MLFEPFNAIKSRKYLTAVEEAPTRCFVGVRSTNIWWRVVSVVNEGDAVCQSHTHPRVVKPTDAFQEFESRCVNSCGISTQMWGYSCDCLFCRVGYQVSDDKISKLLCVLSGPGIFPTCYSHNGFEFHVILVNQALVDALNTNVVVKEIYNTFRSFQDSTVSTHNS